MLTRPRLLIAVAIAVVLVLVVWLVPASRARVTAAAAVADGLGISSWRPFAPTVTTREATVGAVPVDVYTSPRDPPPVVLVPGAVPAGREDPRVTQLAAVLARSDRQVVVPELAVYGEQLVEEDVDRLVDVAVGLSSQDRPVVFVGISFGGSLALVAAADRRLDGRVAGVATFGAYADLVGVAQAATTGVSVVDGRRFVWEADPRAEEVVRAELLSLLPGPEADEVRAALGTDAVGDLSPDARAVYRFLRNDTPERTYALARTLPSAVRDRLAAVSPVAVAAGLEGIPVVAMHTRDDPVIPYGELLRLGAAVPHARLLTVDSLAHADLEVTSPRGWVGALDDLASIWSFTSAAVRWQEPTWPWRPG